MAEDEGGELPAALAERPELNRFEAEIWRSFCEISQGRSAGFAGSSPITLLEIKAYCDFFQVDDQEDRAELCYLVREIDNEFLKIESEKAKQNV